MRITGIATVNFIDLIKGGLDSRTYLFCKVSLSIYHWESYIVYGNEADIIPSTFKWLNPVQIKFTEYPL